MSKPKPAAPDPVEWAKSTPRRSGGRGCSLCANAVAMRAVKAWIPLWRAGKIGVSIAHARDLYNSALAGYDDSLAPMSQAEEIQAAFDALRQALVFTATTRGFLDGNVVG